MKRPPAAAVVLRTPWLTLAPLLVLLPFCMSGAVRFTLGWGFAASLVATVGIAAVGTTFALRQRLLMIAQARSAQAGAATLALASLLVAVTYRLWWTPLFDGLPNSAHGVDLGSHVLIYQGFLTDPKQYEGFVGMYALMRWYVLMLRGDASLPTAIWHGLRFTHYAFLLSVPVAIAAASFPALASLPTRKKVWSAALLALPLQLATFVGVLYPPLQIYGADAYYSQIAGLYPLLFGWLSFGLLEGALARFVVACGWIVVQRFTYGLNLGDTLVTLAVLALWDVRTFERAWLRVVALVFVPLALGAAWFACVKLWPLRTYGPELNSHLRAWILPTQLLLSMLLLFAPTALTSAQVEAGASARRLWRYAGVFGLVNGGLTTLYLAFDEPQLYYITKYHLYATLLVVLGALQLACTLIAHGVHAGFRSFPRPFASGALVVTTLSLLGLVKGYRPAHAMAIERVQRTPDNQQLFAAYEPRLQAMIERTLKLQKKRFGGLYDPWWPRAFVHNALYKVFADGSMSVHFPRWQAAEMVFYTQPGRCYFIVGTPDTYHAAPGSPMWHQLTAFYDQGKHCTSYRPEWNNHMYYRPPPGTDELSVCSLCL